jgi:hypothetical protein
MSKRVKRARSCFSWLPRSVGAGDGDGDAEGFVIVSAGGGSLTCSAGRRRRRRRLGGGFAGRRTWLLFMEGRRDYRAGRRRVLGNH